MHVQLCALFRVALRNCGLCWSSPPLFCCSLPTWTVDFLEHVCDPDQVFQNAYIFYRWREDDGAAASQHGAGPSRDAEASQATRGQVAGSTGASHGRFKAVSALVDASGAAEGAAPVEDDTEFEAMQQYCRGLSRRVHRLEHSVKQLQAASLLLAAVSLATMAVGPWLATLVLAGLGGYLYSEKVFNPPAEWADDTGFAGDDLG